MRCEYRRPTISVALMVFAVVVAFGWDRTALQTVSALERNPDNRVAWRSTGRLCFNQRQDRRVEYKR